MSNVSTYIIAEVGINHNGKLKYALDLVKAAKKAGCDAVKFQTYITDLRVSKNSSIYEILKNCELKFKDFEIINSFCKKEKIDFLTTPFDLNSLDFVVDNLNIKSLKIASFDTSNYKFLREVSKKRVNAIISLGMTSIKTVDKIVNLFNKKYLSLLHCVSGYPIKNIDSNLSNINFLNERYKNIPIGFSDHTKDINIPSYAVLCGAKIIEKHFYLSKLKNCPDYPVSLNLSQMKKMVENIRYVEKIIGIPNFKIKEVEKNIIQFKRFSK